MSENLAIWDAVSKTNPANTKHVNQRGGFTAINANSQIKEATRQFGPIGIGWGYTAGDPIILETLVMVPVTLWHGDRANTFGPVFGAEEWKDSKGRIDSDAPKKAGTDALTKLLSQLGFNADVFLGLFDDQKYVAQVRAEFAGNDKGPEFITDEIRDELALTAESAGVTLAAICKRYGIASLKELPADKAAEVRAGLQATIEQRTQKKAA